MHTRRYHAGRRDPRAGIAIRALAFARHAVEAEDGGHHFTADERTLHARVLLFEMEAAGGA